MCIFKMINLLFSRRIKLITVEIIGILDKMKSRSSTIVLARRVSHFLICDIKSIALIINPSRIKYVYFQNAINLLFSRRIKLTVEITGILDKIKSRSSTIVLGLDVCRIASRRVEIVRTQTGRNNRRRFVT